MPQQWQFEQNDDAKWRWKRIDDAQGDVDSPATFAKEIDCIMDAVRHAVARRRSQTEHGRDGSLQ
jgi:hypothetical protein